MSKHYTTMAIAYDFDGTLAKGNIQENSFIPALRLEKEIFWAEVKALAKESEMDQILAYMYLLISKAKAMDPRSGVKVDKTSIRDHGKGVEYFHGVEKYFARINEYAKSKAILLKHYIISSGTKEMIMGTSIAGEFEAIYASSFLYDQHDIAIWPAFAVNYTTKTQFLFRINKGIKSAWDNSEINKFIPREERPVPFEHIIFIGDGDTDIPAMSLVKYQGGISIAVYPPKKHGAKERAEKLLAEDRVTYMARADYSEGQGIDQIVKARIDEISAKQSIKDFSKIGAPKNEPLITVPH